MKSYPISLEVESIFGMFADPASGSDGRSYPLPPPSACKGIIDSILFDTLTKVDIVGIGTCSFPVHVPYAYNSCATIRKDNLVVKGNACQIRESVLYHPVFQIIAIVSNLTNDGNHAHSFQEQFMRRVIRGQSFFPPSMGRKEFLLDFYRPKNNIFTGFSTVFPSFLFYVFQGEGKVKPDFRQDVEIKNGVMDVIKGACCVTGGILSFRDLFMHSELMNSWAKVEKRYAKRNV